MSSSALLNALSGFWHRFFADIGDLDALYRGTEILAEQLFVELMYEVLGASVRDASLARPETYRVWRMRDSKIRYEGGKWRVEAPVRWHNLRYIQDNAIKPSVVLSLGRDFYLEGDDVVFDVDPRGLLPLAARRTEPVQTGGLVISTDTTGVNPGDTVVLGDGRSFEVMYVSPNALGFTAAQRVYLDAGSITWGVPARSITGRTGSLRAHRVAPLPEIAVWALDGRVDDYVLHRGVGGLLSERQPSTEAYRSFLQGVLRLTTCGPSVQRIVEGLNAAAEIPVASIDGEVVWSVAPEVSQVTTSYTTYTLPAGTPIRNDLTLGKRLRAFETLSSAITVVDEIGTPNWWYGITVPETQMPGVSYELRKAAPNQYQNKVGTAYMASVGDPGLVVGEPWHRSAAYELMNRVLKYNSFGVRFDSSIPPATANKLRALLADVKPAHSWVYTWDDSPVIGLMSFGAPSTSEGFYDAVFADDATSVSAGVVFSDAITAGSAPAVATIGSGGIVGSGSVGGQGATTPDPQSVTDAPVQIDVREG